MGKARVIKLHVVGLASIAKLVRTWCSMSLSLRRQKRPSSSPGSSQGEKKVRLDDQASPEEDEVKQESDEDTDSEFRASQVMEMSQVSSQELRKCSLDVRSEPV